jgi:FG-GAP-like repeat
MRKVLLLAFGLIAPFSGAQTFQNPKLLPTSHAITKILRGDLNGDGFDDLIYNDSGAAPATLHVMLGDGHGSFAQGATLSLPANASDSCILNKFTGSGKLDLACIVQAPTNGGPTPLSIVFLPGNGDGTFAPAKSVSGTSQFGNGVLIDAGDLNGDGAADLVVQLPASVAGLSCVIRWSWRLDGWKCADLLWSSHLQW